jgi:hypothetical protein
VVSVREGTRVRGQLTFGSEGLRFDPIPAQNHPEELRAFLGASERLAADAQGGREIVLEIPMRASPRRASLSLIRAAFVVAFATFGYTYALDPAMDPLLEQIRRPADLLIDPLPIHYDETTPSDLREISIIREPETLHSVLVRMGDAAVFLPVPHDMAFFAEFPRRCDATAPLESNPSAMQLLIERFEWPTSPRHLTITPSASASGKATRSRLRARSRRSACPPRGPWPVFGTSICSACPMGVTRAWPDSSTQA